MGDAYTAIAEDEYSLYYNPALLGRHKGLSLYAINLDLEVTNALDEIDRFENFPSNDPVLITERLLGFPVHFKVGGTPGLKMGNFGLNFFANASTNIALFNAVHPFLAIDYKYDRGFIAGYAFSFGHGGKRNRKNRETEGFGNGFNTSIGFGLKHINRESLSKTFPVFGTTLLNKITDTANSDIYDIRSSLGFSKGKGWGFDVGFDQTWNSKWSQLALSWSWQNIGGVNFNRYEGDGYIPDLEAKMNLGAAWRQDFGIIGYALTFDFRPIDHDIPVSRKFHAGFLLDLPFIDVMYGVSESYTSVGVEISLIFLKLSAGFYSAELGREVSEIEASRAVVFLSLFDFSIDP